MEKRLKVLRFISGFLAFTFLLSIFTVLSYLGLGENITGNLISVANPYERSTIVVFNQIQYKCADSDINIYQAGKIKVEPYSQQRIARRYLKSKEYLDHCQDKKTLIEYSCDAFTNKSVAGKIKCENGCSSGACIF
jgi:hypothetical protein